MSPNNQSTYLDTQHGHVELQQESVEENENGHLAQGNAFKHFTHWFGSYSSSVSHLEPPQEVNEVAETVQSDHEGALYVFHVT